MDLINRLLFGKKFGICAFCGRKIKIDNAVFHKEHVVICSDCNSMIKIAPFELLYKGTENLSFVIAPMYYSGLVRDAIHNLKFNFMPDIAYALAYYINNYLTVLQETDDKLFDNFDMLVPVPLSKIRKNERGYNQAELIAREISSFFNVPVETDSLKKIINTVPQSTLPHEMRRDNLKDAYECSGDVSEKRILLVDDVCTTGNTLEHCARALKSAGAASVGAIAVTHGAARTHSQVYYDLFS